MQGLILSLLMLAGLGLCAGGLYAIFSQNDRKRGALMLVAAVVMFGNVAIIKIPL
jgi:hypothetical protein